MESVYNETEIVKDFMSCGSRKCCECSANYNLKGFNNTEIDSCKLLSTFTEVIIDDLKDSLKDYIIDKIKEL